MNGACHDAGWGGELELPNNLDRNGSHCHVEPHLNRHEWRNGRRRRASTSLEHIVLRGLRGGSFVTARVWRDRGIAIVDPGEEASHSVAGEFARALGTAVKLGGPAVAVTFESVQFVDASALGVILREHQALQECGGRIVLAVVPFTLRRLLAFTGLDATLAVYDSLEDAIIQLSRAHAASRPRTAEGGA
jgi:anti-anti-sigma factor